MKKSIKITLAVILIIFITYTISWVEMFMNSKRYYNDALESYKKKDYTMAIKGKKIESDDENGYVFKGGFQQAAEIWESPYAFPKPSLYKNSQNMIEKIIRNNIDIKTGTDFYKKYFKLDKGYVNDVMLRVIDLYIEDGDYDDARDTLELLKESFPNDSKTLKLAEEKYKKLK